MLILLTIPGCTYKRNPKIFCITMQNGGSGGTFVRYRYHKFYRSRASCFRQFMMLSTIFSAICISTIFPAICIYINCTTFEIANLFFKTKKTTSHQTYKGYIEDTALFTSSTFAEQCYHIVQFLHSPGIVFLTILMTNMQGRILKEKLKDTNGMRQGRSCSIQRMTNLKIVRNLQFLVVYFYKYYIMYAQESLLNLNYVCVCPGMLMYLFIHCVHPGI